MGKPRLCVGVDIGASSIKLCQLGHSGGQLRLLHLASHALEPETIVDGGVMNASRLVDALQTLFRQERIKEKRVAIAVSGHAVIIKNLTMPQMDQEELEASMLMEAEQLIPFDIRDVYFDVQRLYGSQAPAGQMHVMLVAARKDYVREYTSVISEAGLEPVVCDVHPFALETAFLHNYEVTSDKNVALVNLGSSKTTVNILSGTTSGLTRELSIAGNSFTEALQRTLMINADQAERFKRGEKRDLVNDSGEQKAASAVDEVMDALADEVQASFDFFAASDLQGAPTALYLSGGATRMPGLLQALQQRLSTPIEIIDPFRTVQLGKVDEKLVAQLAPSSTMAVGLAMRYAGDC